MYIKNINSRLFVEALIVGILIVAVGTAISYIATLLIKSDMPPMCKDWNKNFIMEICLFVTGFITHILFELIGANTWYCKNGNACVK